MTQGIFSRYLSRGFIFLMACLVLAFVIFLKADDTEPFLAVIQFGVPAWFGLNAVERFAVDRIKAKNGPGPSG